MRLNQMRKQRVTRLKRLLTEWKKNFASYSSYKEQISKIYRKLKKTQPSKKQHSNDAMITWIEGEFSKIELQMTTKIMKKCSTSPVIKEIQLEIALRSHLSPAGVVITMNKYSSKYWWGCRERRTLKHCLCECKLIQPF
jgi:hypothetical protein